VYKVKITINDEYGYYDHLTKRYEIILDLLGLVPLDEWREGREHEQVTMVYYAKTRERSYSSPHSPQQLKLMVKSTELVEVPAELAGKLRDETIIDGVKYVRVCDADVWVTTKKFIFSTWDKVTSTETAQLYNLDAKSITKLSLEKMKPVLANAKPDRLKELRDIEHSILSDRASLAD